MISASPWWFRPSKSRSEIGIPWRRCRINLNSALMALCLVIVAWGQSTDVKLLGESWRRRSRCRCGANLGLHQRYGDITWTYHQQYQLWIQNHSECAYGNEELGGPKLETHAFKSEASQNFGTHWDTEIWCTSGYG